MRTFWQIPARQLNDYYREHVDYLFMHFYDSLDVSQAGGTDWAMVDNMHDGCFFE